MQDDHRPLFRWFASKPDARRLVREAALRIIEERMQPDNPAEGIVGERIGGPPVRSEADHFYVCTECGQAVDMRHLGQVFHHEVPGHQPLQFDS